MGSLWKYKYSHLHSIQTGSFPFGCRVVKIVCNMAGVVFHALSLWAIISLHTTQAAITCNEGES